MGELIFVVVIAAIAGAIGLGLGIVLSRTILQRIADRTAGEDEEPGDRTD
jgi:hypothetical protein